MLKKFQKWIKESKRIVFFGGAGVSTESGVPDFRGTDGLYHQQFEYSPETILSRSFFEQNTEYFFRFYKEKMMPLGFAPNITHLKLAEWEQQGILSAVITQNIDGLHQKAGSKNVLELHGSVLRNYCMKCGESFPAEYIRDSISVPLCSCGGLIKPDVVLYEEMLDQDTLDASADAISCRFIDCRWNQLDSISGSWTPALLSRRSVSSD